MKLEKLVYYAQAWSLVRDERPLFDEPIQAWVNGPVCPDLFEIHKGLYAVAEWPKGDVNKLDLDQCKTIDVVIDFYGKQTAKWLRDLTHDEDPWIIARGDLPDDVNSSNVITPESMIEYYGSLPQ